jgi:hypothetical protein
MKYPYRMLSEGVGGAVFGEAAATGAFDEGGGTVSGGDGDAVCAGGGTISAGDGDAVCTGAGGSACAIAADSNPWPASATTTKAHAPQNLLDNVEGDGAELVI